MVDARRATFAGRWPHDGKKGWKCQTKQHINRSPNCAFFALLNHFGGGNKKKTTRTKAARASKASRLSAQSVATAASDIASVADMTAEPDDSVLTAASTMTQGAKKGTERGKKATARKAAKPRPKKPQAIDEDGAHSMAKEEVAAEPKSTKPPRGKKRASDAMDDSAVLLSEGPSTKRQATATRDSSHADRSTVTPQDIELTNTSKATARIRSSSSQPNRKGSSLTASMASLRAPATDFPDDDEIERQLEADLERFTTDDEIARDSETEQPMEKPGMVRAKPMTFDSRNYAMFDPAEPDLDEEAIDDELRNLQAEMEVAEPEQEIHVPKKGRKKGTGARKASKQANTTRIKAPSPPCEPEDLEQPGPCAHEASGAGKEEENEMSVGSTDTVVKKTETAPSCEEEGRRRQPTGSPPLASRASSQPADAPLKRGRGRPPKMAANKVESDKPPELREDACDSLQVAIHEDVAEAQAAEVATEPRQSPSLGQTSSPILSRSRSVVPEQPSTPTQVISPAPSARLASQSPSPSPQSSDAENLPPSSVVLASARPKRVVLAPVAATPMRTSPSKRNMLAAGLQSQTPWKAVDLDAVLGTPHDMADKENAVARLIKQGKELSSPEKGMTVEEWIYFNAGEAENKLKHECEAMVTLFEEQGAKAMSALEGLSLE
ncbi:hypothetical protein UVI_02025590 [Ustilaginoidea virens]|uniref:Uncharacterized protein n=1 Tax=Ustilaginoidea virens TaxID=1159556 RepID=A0A1B5KR58_USTVR|nr:hypothetical protein UVI_02025590 [Ustilaginoidea virens]